MSEHPPPNCSSSGVAQRGSVILAAGGVVIDRRGDELRVLVVHRPTYDDWTLPKGHIDGRETAVTAAIREVIEESGVEARILRALSPTEYSIGSRLKRVQWFLMERAPDAAEPSVRTPDSEVDIAAWWKASVARRRLTYAADRELVQSALAATQEIS